ncbi:MAG: hypothetical protein J6P62_11685 [Bacteroidales bacterium]|nr:hypothetical protein [Bacteroidales bacterium]
MTREDVSRELDNISRKMFTMANDDAFKQFASSPVMNIIREFLKNTAFTIDTLVEELDDQIELEKEDD